MIALAASVTQDPYPGYAVKRPAAWTAPFVFASPHSGRAYPKRFLAASRLGLLELRRSEDALVDLLLPDPDTVGVPVLTADFPRAFVDVNRAPYELDPLLFDAPIPGDHPRSGRVLAGFGVIPKLAAEGRSIYARKLSAQEGRARIKWCYEPYHAALRGLITECLTRFGRAMVVDWHSMPSAGEGRRLADVVLGDRFGASCEPAMVRAFELAFGEEGWRTSRNSPYAGGYVTSLYGRPKENVSVLQIELNRALYLDEVKVRRTGAFAEAQARIARVLSKVMSPAEDISFAAE